LKINNDNTFQLDTKSVKVFKNKLFITMISFDRSVLLEPSILTATTTDPTPDPRDLWRTRRVTVREHNLETTKRFTNTKVIFFTNKRHCRLKSTGRKFIALHNFVSNLKLETFFKESSNTFKLCIKYLTRTSC
jgi:hypothetical protein